MKTNQQKPIHLIYYAAGSPPMVVSHQGVCRTCKSFGDGILFRDWVKDTFTDHDKLYPGQIVCQACQFSFAEQSEILRQRLGKDKPQKARNYSHFVLNGEWYPLSKAQKTKMRDLFFQNPEVAIVAASGQKHIIFRARLGWWQIEEQSVAPFPGKLKHLLGAVEPLYFAGFSKDEIEFGTYQQNRILKIGMPFWKEHEHVVAPHRNTIRLSLALFLAQKPAEETEDGAESD